MMDYIRQIVTQIGNAIGFISVIRAASMRWSYDIFKFIPKF